MGPLDRLRRLRKEVRVEGIARVIEKSAPDAARRFRDANSDAGRYLRAQASSNDRMSSLLQEAAAIETSIEENAFWLTDYEWRIGTAGSERVERTRAGYLVTTTCHGVFTAEVDLLQVALEAKQVLAGIQRDLFWAIGWSSWADRNRLEPDDPPQSHSSNGGEPYPIRLSNAAIERFRPELSAICAELEQRGAWQNDVFQIRPATWRDWDGAEKLKYEATVETGHLSMACDSPTIGRATQFAGIYESLQTNIRRVLEWGS